MSVTKKLFAAIALTAAIIVAFMAVMIAVSMRSGFSQYLLQAELDRFDDLAAALAEDYDPDEPNWPDLAGDQAAWSAFTREHVRQEADGRPSLPPTRPGLRAPGAAVEVGRQLPPPNPDPLQLGSRLALLDANGDRLVGPEDTGDLTATRAIPVIDADSQAVTVGWISLAAPEGGVVTADSVFLAGQFRTLLLSALLAIVASAIAAFLLARQFLAPVRELVRGTEVLAAGDYTARMPETRRDEFGELIGHFNVLAESLEKSEKAERQWISDASHELQTPLAVLRAEVEALQDGVRQPDEKTLGDMNASILRLSQLVGDLNALSHAREDRLLAEMAETDVSAVVEEAADAARPRLAEAGLTLETEIAGGLTLACDSRRIRQLVDNLLENARRYTNSPGRVALSLLRQGDKLILRVEDTAPAPPEEAMDKLFDRFYRADSSRSRQSGGSGLGLAICQAIVRAHGGGIGASRSRLGGLAVRVELPGAG